MASEASGSALISVRQNAASVSLTYHPLSYVQHVLCVCWLLQFVPALALSRVVPSLVDFLLLPRVVSALVRRLLCCRPLTL